MRVTHKKPESWVDTAEPGKIQSSAVVGLEHEIELTQEDVELLRGPQGDKGDAGAQGKQGVKGDTGAQGVAPAGAVLHFAMAAPPVGWLVCDGSLKSRATYAALFAAIGTLYGAGDGATTFKLPDLRGEFLRGLDGGRGVDVGRVAGSFQGDALQGHLHKLRGSGTADAGSAYVGGVSNVNDAPVVAMSYYGANGLVSDGVNGVPRSAAETRPRNVALLACISTGGA